MSDLKEVLCSKWECPFCGDTTQGYSSKELVEIVFYLTPTGYEEEDKMEIEETKEILETNCRQCGKEVKILW